MKYVEKYKIDDLDRQILWGWDFDARQSAAQIAKRINSNKNTVNYRMNRLLEEGVVTGSFAELDTAKFGYNNIKTYFQLQDFNREIEQNLIDYLKRIRHVGWIVSCSGKWDALFCYWAKSSYDFFNVYTDILKKFTPHIMQKDVIQNINWFYYNRKWLTDKHHIPTAIKYGGEPSVYKLDKIDSSILNMLVRNGRTSIVDMAKDTKQSSQTVINHIAKLEQDKVITKYSLSLDYNKMGIIFCKTFVYLKNITQERLEQLYQYCANEPRVFAMATTLGAWDIEIELEVENFEQMREIMDRMRIHFSDIVKNYESVIILKQTVPNYIVG